MALVNALSSLSISAPKAAGLGFKKAVSAFVAPPARVGAGRSAVFAVEAKQNKKARVIQVRSAPRTGHGARERTSRARVFVDTRVHAREPRSARAVSRRVAPNARARRAMYQNPRTRLFFFVFL